MITDIETPKEDSYTREADNQENGSQSSQSSYGAGHHHPNAPKNKKHTHNYKGCAKYMFIFDNAIMKPWLVYKYHKNMYNDQLAFFTLLKSDLNTIEKDYV